MPVLTAPARPAAPPAAIEAPSTPMAALRSHWPEYLMEAALLGAFMMSACVFSALLEHPSSALHRAVENPLARRAVTGLAMGATLIALVYSGWGKQSGAHMNPAFTLTSLALGKVRPWDAAFYVVAQLAGGIAGVAAAGLLIGPPLAHGAVNFAATVPGPAGAGTAFGGEFVISLVQMSVVLLVSNSRRLAPYTALFAGALVALYITVEAPLSGMSMNPARTLGSAVSAAQWTALWVYFTAPPLAMLTAGLLYRSAHGARHVYCAKLHHDNNRRCIFRCNYGALHGR